MFRQIFILAAAAVPALFAAGELEQARRSFARANYQQTLAVLAPVANALDASVQELLGKSYFMVGDFKKAAEALETAASLESGRSDLHHWLGKAYGRRAEQASPFQAPFLAKKARDQFEKAVALNPRNAEAVNDLFTYYLEAPGFLGGGIDKAAALANEKIRVNDPAEYHYAMAQIAERRKEFRTAESHFRQAFSLAPQSVGRAIDLARFLGKQGRVQESEAVFAQAEKIAPNAPRLLFERASLYVRHKQNLPQARAMLQRYLASPLTADDPPPSEARKLLKEAGA